MRIIEISTRESIKICKILVFNCNLLKLINADLNSPQFLCKIDKKPKESKIVNCTKMYFSIIWHLLDLDDNLNQKISNFITETLDAATVQKYKKSKCVLLAFLI